MEQQNEQTLEEVSIANSSDLINNENDFLAFYQSNFIKIELRSYFFYFLPIFEMLFITIVSSFVIFPTSENDSSGIKFFNAFLSYCYISPSLFSHTSITFLVIGIVLLLIILIIGYTFYIGFKFRKDETSLNVKSLNIWVVLYRLFLPFPGFIIGCYFGNYFQKLTNKLYTGQLFLIIYTGMIWCWSIVSSGSLYNSRQYKRKYDICQIHHNCIAIESFIIIMPLIQSMLPYIISVFTQTSSGPLFYSCITALISLFMMIYIPLKKPYYTEFMNQYIIFLFLLKIPVSLTWMVEMTRPNKFGLYLLFCFIFAIASFALIKLISLCIHRLSLNANTLQINQNQSNVNVSSQDSEIRLNFQLVDDSEEQNQLSTCDPFINCRYPINIISLTYRDVILGVYLIFGIVFMILANAAAAQRMPVTKALPDIVQDNFFIADYLRTHVANSTFQISNVLILVQVPLLIYFFLVYSQYLNLRRFVTIYGTLCLIRGVSFLITSLPAPCAGAPNCPCADPKTIQSYNEGSILKIAFSWLFGLGIFLKYPQCGDLILSGHTMWLWLVTRTLCSVISQIVPKPFNWLANSSLITLSLIAMGYIILSKNHYSIDVWFGFIFTEILFDFYNSLWTQSVHPIRDDDSLLVRIIRFVETRPAQRILMQTRKMQLQNNS